MKREHMNPGSLQDRADKKGGWHLEQLVHIIGIAAALVSCGFWLSAAFIRFRPLSLTRLRGPESIPATLQRQSLLNGIAAIFAAVAAAAQAVASFSAG